MSNLINYSIRLVKDSYYTSLAPRPGNHVGNSMALATTNHPCLCNMLSFNDFGFTLSLVQL